MNEAKDFLLKISTENIIKNEAQELYNNLIKPDTDVLKKSKDKSFKWFRKYTIKCF